MSVKLPSHTLQATTHLSWLAVHVDLRQAGWLFGGSEGLKLTEVCKIGLLWNLLGGGGGEHRSASWCTLCFCTMPGVWYWCLQRGKGRVGWRPSYCQDHTLCRIYYVMQLDLLICCTPVPEHTVSAVKKSVLPVWAAVEEAQQAGTLS